MSAGKAILRMVLSSETIKRETHSTASTAQRCLPPPSRLVTPGSDALDLGAMSARDVGLPAATDGDIRLFGRDLPQVVIG